MDVLNMLKMVGEVEDCTCDECGLHEKDVVVADQTWMHEWPTEDGTYEHGYLCPACIEKIPRGLLDDYHARDMAKCALCVSTVANLDAAQDEGWEPYFWSADSATCFDQPVCPACTQEHLHDPDNTGDMKLRA